MAAQFRLITGELRGWGFIFPATVAAIFYLLPHLFPLFAPGERPAADRADFLREMAFFY